VGLITIRKAKGGDLEVINKLTDEMHRYLECLYGLELTLDELEEEHFDEEELENTWVAEIADKGVVGYMSFSRGVNEWAGPNYELEHIVVSEEHQGLGIGKKLFDIILEKAEKEKVNITTGTLARNEKALTFYERFGFKPLSIGLLLDFQKRLPSFS